MFDDFVWLADCILIGNAEPLHVADKLHLPGNLVWYAGRDLVDYEVFVVFESLVDSLLLGAAVGVSFGSSATPITVA